MAGASTVIAEGTEINGHLEGGEDVDVHGTLRGSVRLEGNLLVTAGGRVEADVEAHAVVIHGILAGNVQARDVVEMTAGAKVLGDLTAPTIILEEGAAYSGLLDTGNVGDEASSGRNSSGRSSRDSGRSSRDSGSRDSGRSSRDSGRSSRPTEAPKAAAPKAPEPTKTPEPAKAPEPPKAEAAPAEDEPELPAAASKKKVNVKKRS